ncbi:hypothetical protein [Alkalihalobacillus trypoxylicola]|uniref:Uncharacterized protein n=1 Tax=Alkalihalobacillus trypoxylicola TaxID=519424 RepID=A0A162CQF9_9BACI|nr:hypothetical protein [Alkalihalobacillus trypoxylicola]KYG26012.1 hypothetical protein AZF04_13070 [Alkalihalobacillus trypoxylicola]
MKAKYVIPIIIISIIGNGVNLYNFPLGFLSIFILLMVILPNIFNGVIVYGRKMKSKGYKSILIDTMVDFDAINHSKIIYIVGLILLYMLGAAFMIFQLTQFEYWQNFITINANVLPSFVSNLFFMIVGDILFLASLVVVIMHFRYMFREAPVFQKSNKSKYI